MRNIKETIAKEIRKIVNEAIEKENKKVVEAVKNYIEYGPTQDTKENLHIIDSDFALYQLKNKGDYKDIDGEFEFETGTIGYELMFKGSFQGVATVLIPAEKDSYSGLEIFPSEIEVLVESTVELISAIVDGDEDILDVLSNKNVIPENVLQKIEKTISDKIKEKLES